MMLRGTAGESSYPILGEEGEGGPRRSSSWAGWTLRDKMQFTRHEAGKNTHAFAEYLPNTGVCLALCWPLGVRW